MINKIIKGELLIQPQHIYLRLNKKRYKFDAVKKLLLLSLLLTTNYSLLYSQNLVPNPSFEEYDSCPTGFNQMDKVKYWDAYKATPDYFNVCDTQYGVSVPSNEVGWQYPASGNAYIGLFTYAFPVSSDYREIIGAKLLNPLEVGQKYEISFKINLTLDTFSGFNCAINKMGIMFSTIPYTTSFPPSLINKSHISSNEIAADTTGWTTISGSFIADSAYQYIMLGNFFTDAEVDTMIFFNPEECAAYYYIDDISVMKDGVGLFENINNSRKDIIFFQNKVFIQNPKETPIQIKIYSLSGQLIQYKSYNTSTIVAQFDNIPSGLYFIQINNNNFFYTNKMLINH